MDKRDQILKKLKQELDSDRFNHCLRTEKIAIKLAKKYGVSEQAASLAALLHDCAKKYDPYGLLHAELSAQLAKKKYGVSSKQVLRAIKHHTTGTPNMSKLEKIIYLADHIEEGRQHKNVSKVRQAAEKDLDLAIVLQSTSTLRFLLDQKLPVHQSTNETRNYYLLRAKS
ncbi:MAG: bis(5'-nucleosyl)-tetraphosphatase (symmetrical) YqeK [bacterium]|nr:bis(5'-nucleosyl)-tetraphosphatase (symmetrical) YqeK [Candidatus Margulisiibacteriota bacterium]